MVLIAAVVAAVAVVVGRPGKGATLLPNPPRQFVHAIGAAASARIQIVNASREWCELHASDEGITLPDEVLSEARRISPEDFVLLQRLLVGVPRFHDVSGPVKACVFHPDVQISFFSDSGRMMVTLTACFTCGDWWLRMPGESVIMPLGESRAIAAIALAAFPEDKRFADVVRELHPDSAGPDPD